MTTLKKWLIALDFSAIDQNLLKYASNLAEIIAPNEISFLHVAERTSIPAILRKELPGLREPDLKEKKDFLAENAKSYQWGAAKVFFDVVEGEVLAEILRYARDASTDLLLVGKKASTNGGGGLPRKLARKSPCSVFFVPESARPNFKHIFLPIDFSDYSLLSLERAVNLALQVPACAITCQHVYDSADWYLNETFLASYEVNAQLKRQKELNEKLEKYYQQEMEKFLQQIDTKGIIIQTLLTANPRATHSVSQKILENAEQQSADFLLMGSHGQSISPSLLLGKVFEKVNKENQTIPLLLLKKKGENQSLLKVLLG